MYSVTARDMRDHFAKEFPFKVHKRIPRTLLNRYQRETAFEISISEERLGKKFLRWIDTTSVIMLLYGTLLRIIASFKDLSEF